MRGAAVVRILAAAAAGALAAVAGYRAHADAAYRRGLGYTDRPAEDVAGRLEAYEEAVRRSPRCFTYLLRTGQIHLGRASTPEGLDAQHLRRAEECLRAAADVHPLDARVHVELARLLVVTGDPDGALTRARRAVELGPRHPSVQEAAVLVAVGVWDRLGRLDALATALDLDAVRTSWRADVGPLRGVQAALRRHEARAVGDLLEACGRDTVRLATARAWSERALSDAVPVLDAALRRAAGGR